MRTWVGMAIILLGGAIYFRCAWEFAVRGLGTPARVAPTKFLVTTALHRYVRDPMYIGVFGVILGEAATFRSLWLLAYAHSCVYPWNCLSSSTRSVRSAANLEIPTKNIAGRPRVGFQSFAATRRAPGKSRRNDR